MNPEFGKNKKSKLARLQERIYSRINPPKRRQRRKLFSSQDIGIEVSKDVDFKALGLEEEKDNKQEEEKKEAPLSKFYKEDLLFEEPEKFWNFSKVLLLISLIFFIASVSLAYYFVVKGLNEVDPNKISLLVKAPEYVKSGDITQFQIIVENRNPAALELTDLFMEYPPGTIVSGNNYKLETLTNDDGSLRRVVTQRTKLGKIEPGELKRGTLRAKLFGRKDETKKVTAMLEYRVKGSSAIYSVKKTIPITFLTGTIDLYIDGPKEAIFGQDPEYLVTLKNTSLADLYNVKLKAELPLGVKILESTPKMTEDNLWVFKRIGKGEEAKVRIKMRMDGQSGDIRVIKFKAGTAAITEEDKVINALYQDADHKVTIAKPFLYTDIILPRKKNNYYVLAPGASSEATLEWVNTLPDPIENLVLVVSLSGEALDKYKVKANKGFYKSRENLIVWDRTTVGKLFEHVPAGKSGQLRFSVGSKNPEELVKIQNPEITMELHASAKRLNESGVQNALNAANTKKIRVESFVTFSSRALYFSNPLKSAGALPPKADKPTVYGIEWKITNTSNTLKDVTVRAFLPPNVDWGKIVLPATERVTYNPSTGEVIWRAGEVKPGTGYYLPSRKVYFNLILTPSVSQIGSSPDLLSNIEFTSTDSWTDTEIKIKIPKTDTKLNEEGASEFYNKVVK